MGQFCYQIEWDKQKYTSWPTLQTSQPNCLQKLKLCNWNISNDNAEQMSRNMILKYKYDVYKNIYTYLIFSWIETDEAVIEFLQCVSKKI